MANSQVPAWTVLIDTLALECLRTNLRIEFDLRAVLRSQGSPGAILERAEVILEIGTESLIEQLLAARGIFYANRFDLCGEQSRRVAEEVAGMYLLLLARVSGLAYLKLFREKESADVAVEFVKLVAGAVPFVVELERDTDSFFDRPQMGISAA